MPVTIKGLTSVVGLRSRPSDTQITRRSLLRFVQAAPALLLSTTARAEPARPKGSDPAILINEDPSDPKGLRNGGWVTWRADRIKTDGQPDSTAVHADVEIPDLAIRMVMDFRRNTDKSLPASHVVEVSFASPQSAVGRNVVSLPGISMKSAEHERGMPLVTRTAKIANGSFLIGLSDVNVDREHNLRLLKERSWFDIPLVYANQRRGILAISKGSRGRDVFRKAVLAWERPQ